MARILVVEDDVNNAKVLRAVLRRIGGFEVSVTENVDEIFSLVRGGAVDLVIMDVSLSNSYFDEERLDGLEITRRLKDDPLARTVPVVLATAHAMTGDRERFLTASGADGYVTKPVLDHHALVDRIRELIVQRTAERG
jgi:CheY-like chemotaxis protein